MLALLARDLSSDTLPSTLSVLSRLRLVSANADASTFDAWTARLMSLLTGPAMDLHSVAMQLLRETIKQCRQEEFARHREAWVRALLLLLQPNSSATDAAALASVRLASAEALVQMAVTASTWPPERREMSSTISQLASNLVSMVSEPITHGDVRARTQKRARSARVQCTARRSQTSP